MIMKDKKGFVDTEILTSVGFVILAVMSVGATVIGYIMGQRMGYDAFPVWQLILIILIEIVASYLFVDRMS